LLGGAPCLVVLQTHHVTDHVTLRLHIGGHDLINVVTSEGNWLHQILFRGFTAKGVNTYAHTTFIYLFIFPFTSPIWTILYMSATCNPNKNLFKLQFVMQQNWKNAKGCEYICKALYLPREFSSILFVAIYLPPQTNAGTKTALNALYKAVNK
jgi:hypothetical protein